MNVKPSKSMRTLQSEITKQQKAELKKWKAEQKAREKEEKRRKRQAELKVKAEHQRIEAEYYRAEAKRKKAKKSRGSRWYDEPAYGIKDVKRVLPKKKKQGKRLSRKSRIRLI